MKILGVVAEYNPFHLGHKYQLDMAKKSSQCEVVAVVMSGNYVQRGEPAIIDKYKRAEIAVKNGVDLVIELPFPFSCQNAELFSLGAIKELKKINVSTISFGCENTDIDLLNKIAELQLNNTSEYNSLLKGFINEGLSYPSAINNTINTLLNKTSYHTDDMILLPNNTLGLEYIKASKKINYEVDFLPIKRHMAQHNDKKITNKFASATAIRNEILDLNLVKTKASLPPTSYSLLKDYHKEHKIFNNLDRYLELIYYKIISSSKSYLKNIYDITEGLENKIYDNACKHKTLDDFITSIKSKRYTYSRIRRILLNILLDITREDMDYLKENDNNYVKALAFNINGKKILNYAKENNTAIITKFSDYRRNAIDTSKDKIFEMTKKSSDIYYMPHIMHKRTSKQNLEINDKYLNSEYKRNVIFVKD